MAHILRDENTVLNTNLSNFEPEQNPPSLEAPSSTRQQDKNPERHTLSDVPGVNESWPVGCQYSISPDPCTKEPGIVCPVSSKRKKISGLKLLSPIKSWSRNLRLFLGIDLDTFWYISQTAPPPSNYTPGVIPVLKNLLLNSHTQGLTCQAALCYERFVYISQELWDMGWGCGYRNFLMACTALMDQSSQPLYTSLLDAPTGPGIRKLQTWIEDAWKDGEIRFYAISDPLFRDIGFDPHGAKELKKLVGTRKWIGTTDLWVAFSHRGIPAELVDFDLRNQKTGFNVVTDWIMEYFTPKSPHKKSPCGTEALPDASPIVMTDKMPIILQHSGHSRTIVGYEVSKKGRVRLLTFDPAHALTKNIRNAAMLPSSPSSGSPLTTQQSQKRRLALFSLGYAPSKVVKHSRRVGPVFVNSPEYRQRERCDFTSDRDTWDGISGRTLKRFLLDTKKLRKRRYQILYFPMTTPLTIQERIQRKEVASIKIC